MRARGGGGAEGFHVAFPRPSRTIIAIIAINVAIWVLYLVLLRGGAGFVERLGLRPADVFERGYLWQPLTYMLLHAPSGPGHLLMNMVMLYFFGTPMERWWSTRRFVFAYVFFGLAGAALTLFVAALHLSGVFGTLLANVFLSSHVGASGAVTGIIVAWGIVHANERMQFLLLGEMKGRTFVLIVIAFELLVALSYSPVSSTSHFGGMIGAAVLVWGLWKPAGWRKLFRRSSLSAKKKKLEHELRVIKGGKDDDEPPPTVWN